VEALLLERDDRRLDGRRGATDDALGPAVDVGGDDVTVHRGEDGLDLLDRRMMAAIWPLSARET